MNAKILALLASLLFVSGTTFGLTGCQSGGFEQAGEEVDEAIDDAEDAVD